MKRLHPAGFERGTQCLETDTQNHTDVTSGKIKETQIKSKNNNHAKPKTTDGLIKNKNQGANLERDIAEPLDAIDTKESSKLFSIKLEIAQNKKEQKKRNKNPPPMN